MPNSPKDANKDAKEKDSRPPTLSQLLDFGAKDITQRALSGQLKRAYGRDAEVGRVLASLERKRSVILMGAADVGKTAILHEVVQRMIRPQGTHCPEALAGTWVVAVSTGDVLTGTHYLGEWQTRLTELLELIKRGGKVLLYFEDIWALRDAGRASDKAEGFATLIRPYVERGDMQILGETTPDNFHAASYGARALADDQSLLRAFDVLTVEEPTSEATKTILTQVAKSLRAGGSVRIETSAIERALELSRRFLPYAAFPGKAIRLLNEAAQNGTEHHGSTGKSATATTTTERVIASDEVTAAFSKVTGLPEKMLSDRIGLKQSEIRAYFEERVIGQEEAVGAVADVVTLVKAEMNDPTRPLGILFFVGPTGVGKTELAKTLAEYLFGSKEKLIRLDMSEFKSPLSISDFLSQLTEKQRRQIFSVLLLDEIEKASPAVFDLFLQVFGDGRLSDATGRSVDLRNTIIIMTSNLGNIEVAELTPHSKAIGFLPASTEDAKDANDTKDGERMDAETRARALRAKAMRGAVEDFFRPEFINRLDRIVVFQPLGRDELRRIARRELGKALLREGIVRRNILIEPRDEVFDALLAQGYSPQYGARPMQRVIGELVLLPLARAIAEQPAMGEQLLELVVRDGRIETEVIPLEASAPEEPVAEEPHERVSVLDAQTGRARSLDARGLEQVIEEQRLRVEQHLAGERYEQLSARQQTLIDEMNRPSFWDDQDRSRRVLSEIYHVDTMRNRLTDLRNRAEGLAEAARMIRLHNDIQGRARLVESYERLAQDVAMAEMELIASGGEAAGIETLFLRILPRPHKAAEAPEEAHTWARELEGMYLGWARRKGYDAEALAEAAESIERLLLLRGPNLSRMLAGEAGVHRMEGDSEGEPPAGRARRKPGPPIFLAHVELFPAQDDADAPETVEGVQVRVLSSENQDGRGERREVERRGAGRADGRRDGRPRSVAEASDAKSGLVVRVRAAEAERMARLLLLARLGRPVAEPSSEEVVRVYRVGKTQYVHDKRTGERDGQPKRVLGGGIDRFLLAYLVARQALVAATERDGHGE